ncbi:hypothetical protein AQUSIP_20790 [Aquicella siphonis]|uniref:Uncharacterized protein n=1 Tax=Aquicella siphonis TaxID=254247 RepID=A0A5E4PK60_9COXI|nr:DUF3421 domain-containing protein [Aquicella siphonis]VVC76753.1 hypothetical protein AQUSIP_20790 [Aquicella siphonis]
MKARVIYLALSSLCIAGVAGTAQAEDYYSSQNPGGGYTSSASASSGYYSSSSDHHKEYKKERDKVSISVNLPFRQDTYIVSKHGRPHHYRGPEWVGMYSGLPLPSHAVVGGGQSFPPASLFVCRGNYRGGVHPGKLYKGRCNIGWGGNEIVLSHYEVLTSRRPLTWVSASFGRIPAGAIQGGYQHDGPLFVCQADYHGGTHIGKVVGQNCNFGWGGREITIPYYNVLVG